MNKTCETCRYWDALSLEARKGDCRAPNLHRYWRVQSPAIRGLALMDSFGVDETLATHSCEAWAVAQADGTLDLRDLTPAPPETAATRQSRHTRTRA